MSHHLVAVDVCGFSKFRRKPQVLKMIRVGLIEAMNSTFGARKHRRPFQLLGDEVRIALEANDWTLSDVRQTLMLMGSHFGKGTLELHLRAAIVSGKLDIVELGSGQRCFFGKAVDRIEKTLGETDDGYLSVGDERFVFGPQRTRVPQFTGGTEDHHDHVVLGLAPEGNDMKKVVQILRGSFSTHLLSVGPGLVLVALQQPATIALPLAYNIVKSIPRSIQVKYSLAAGPLLRYAVDEHMNFEGESAIVAARLVKSKEARPREFLISADRGTAVEDRDFLGWEQAKTVLPVRGKRDEIFKAWVYRQPTGRVKPAVKSGVADNVVVTDFVEADRSVTTVSQIEGLTGHEVLNVERCWLASEEPRVPRPKLQTPEIRNCSPAKLRLEEDRTGTPAEYFGHVTLPARRKSTLCITTKVSNGMALNRSDQIRRFPKGVAISNFKVARLPPGQDFTQWSPTMRCLKAKVQLVLTEKIELASEPEAYVSTPGGPVYKLPSRKVPQAEWDPETRVFRMEEMPADMTLTIILTFGSRRAAGR